MTSPTWQTGRKAFYGCNLENGTSVIVQRDLSEADIAGYQASPDTYFGVVKPSHKPIRRVLDAFDFCHESCKDVPRERLLKLMWAWPDPGTRENLPQGELAKRYSAAMAESFLMQMKQPQGASRSIAQPPPEQPPNNESVNPTDKTIIEASTGMADNNSPNRLFAGIEAVLREALTNPSPYYRLLLAYRGFEGVKRLRRHFPESAKKHSIDVPPLSDMKLDKTEMAQHGFRDEILTFETLDQLFEHFKNLRDACAHFFVGSRGKAARQHLHLSSTLVHTCGKVAALMLMYVRRDLAYLKDYHRRHFSGVTNIGMLLPMEGARERFRVVCPDDEASAPPDEFNR